jgi:hypothetical protein
LPDVANVDSVDAALAWLTRRLPATPGR